MQATADQAHEIRAYEARSKIKLPKYIIAVTGSNGKTSTVEMIYQVLNENSDKSAYPNLAKKWGKIIFQLTKTVINNVSPSFQDLND